MKWLKKIAAGILMVLAVLGLLICVAGLVGALAVNAPLSNAVVVTIETAEVYFTSIDQTTDRLQNGFASLHENVGRIQNLLISTDIPDGSVLRTAINRIAGEDIKPAMEGLISTTSAVSNGVVAVNTALVAFNQIPGINLPTITEELEAVDNGLEAFRRDLEELQTNLSTSQDIKNRLLQPVNRLAESLDQAEATLAAGKSKITAVRASLASLRVTIPRLIDMASLVLAIIFIL